MINLPTSPTVGTKVFPWTWDGEKWATETVPVDGPRDGVCYARKGGAWVPTFRRDRPTMSGLSTVTVDVPPEAKMMRWRYGCMQTDTTSNLVYFSLSFDGTTFKEGASDYYVSGNWHATSPSSQFVRQAPIQSSAMYMTWTSNSSSYAAFSRGHMALEVDDPATQRFCSFFDIEVYHATNGIFNIIGHNFTNTGLPGALKRVQKIRVFFSNTASKFAANNGLALEWIC